MEYLFETSHLKIRKFELDDAECLYKNHLEEEVKKWIPNESYADIEEIKEAKIKRKNYSDEERKIIYNKSGGRYELCGMRLSFMDMTLDHIIPLSMGGEDSMENLQTACYACNQFKSNILPDDFMDRIIKIFLYQTEKKCSKDLKLRIIHKLVETL